MTATKNTPTPLTAAQRRRRDTALAEIAQRKCRRDLIERRSDREDFKEIGVVGLREALEAAYDAGRMAAEKAR